MRKFRTVFMRGGTSKGCLFHKSDLPADRAEWDEIFLQVMGCPDPKQIDGMGGTVSSNNKIVVIWSRSSRMWTSNIWWARSSSESGRSTTSPTAAT